MSRTRRFLQTLDARFRKINSGDFQPSAREEEGIHSVAATEIEDLFPPAFQNGRNFLRKTIHR